MINFIGLTFSMAAGICLVGGLVVLINEKE